RCPAKPLHPPAVSGSPNRHPVVKRIAPTLAGCTEIVGRNTGNDLGLKIVFAQPEQLAIRPHIGALEIYENRNVTDDANSLLRTIRAQCAPLLPKEKLSNPAQFQLTAGAVLQLLHRAGFTTRELGWPLTPVVPISSSQKIERNVIFQPPGVF